VIRYFTQNASYNHLILEHIPYILLNFPLFCFRSHCRRGRKWVGTVSALRRTDGPCGRLRRSFLRRQWVFIFFDGELGRQIMAWTVCSQRAATHLRDWAVGKGDARPRHSAQLPSSHGARGSNRAPLPGRRELLLRQGRRQGDGHHQNQLFLSFPCNFISNWLECF